MPARRIEAEWDRVVPALSEEGLLLAVASHRVANEVSAAIAAMRLSLSGRWGSARLQLVEEAIARLEGFAEVVQALKIPSTARYDLRQGIEDLCDSLCHSRRGIADSMVTYDLADIRVDGATARRLLMIVAELVQNSIRHALQDRAGSLTIVLRGNERVVRLAVVDDGPGIRPDAPTSGTGMGSHIVAEMVRRGGGELSCQTGPGGTNVRVVMPVTESAGAGWDE
jgi:two-component sensor histidine kinase